MAEIRFNNGDAISAAVLAGLGGYIVMEARTWDYLTPDGPGPGFFPIWYGVALVILSLVVIGSRLIRISQARGADSASKAAPRDGPGEARKRSEIYHALAVWVAFAACVALLKVLGFLLALGLLTLFLVALIYRRPWKVALAVAVGISAGFYLVFPLALSVPLPVGVFGL
ncbi:MAG TPA: tripartite tricarboxylate transporter TctB family protein [Burkholderiales bacterium]|nr:tripartite tricarboxylate transporter TctB family protein [Burkholderiales bacterium]